MITLCDYCHKPLEKPRRPGMKHPCIACRKLHEHQRNVAKNKKSDKME